MSDIEKIDDDREVWEYMERFKNVPPEDILKYMGELRDFFHKYMTDEGRKFFEESR